MVIAVSCVAHIASLSGCGQLPSFAVLVCCYKRHDDVYLRVGSCCSVVRRLVTKQNTRINNDTTAERMTFSDGKRKQAKLEEPLIVRPTSETIIWTMFRKWIDSHR